MARKAATDRGLRHSRAKTSRHVACASAAMAASSSVASAAGSAVGSTLASTASASWRRPILRYQRAESREWPHGKEQEDGGDGRDPQHDAPCIAVDEEVVGEIGEEDANGDRHLIERDETATNVRRRILRPVERRGDGGQADAGTEDQAADDEDARVGRQRFEESTHDEHGGGQQDGGPAAEPFGQRAGDERAGHRPERHPARDDLDDDRAGMERLVDAGQRPRNDALVVAEQEPGQHDDEADGEEIAAHPLAWCHRRGGRHVVWSRHPSTPPASPRWRQRHLSSS